jgi:CheY-like chemotaxis protein
MKKILVCEDSYHKFEGIEKAILKLFDEVEITRVSYAKAAVVELKENPEKYDYLIQDMQLPINSDGRIDIKGGIYVLQQIKRREYKIKYCICSSDNSSYNTMVENGFENIPFINYSSFEFIANLKEFLNSENKKI